MSKTLYIDADSLLYLTIFSRSNNGTDFDEQEGEDFGVVKPDMKSLKAQFKALVWDVVSSCEVESTIGEMTKFKDHILVFTGSTNFRYDIFPEYKNKRKDDKPDEFYKLKKWAVKKFGIISDIAEADDIVSYYARKGHPITSADKDVLKGTPGYHYDTYHKCFVRTSKKEALEFTCLQALGGDSGDGIPGLPGIGIKLDFVNHKFVIKAPRALKLLGDDKTLEKVVQIYIDKGFDKDHAITMIRLVHMGQIKKITRKGKIKLELYNEA